MFNLSARTFRRFPVSKTYDPELYPNWFRCGNENNKIKLERITCMSIRTNEELYYVCNSVLSEAILTPTRSNQRTFILSVRIFYTSSSHK